MLYHPPLNDLALRVANFGTIYAQVIHRLDLRLSIGSDAIQGLTAHLTAYALNPDGSLGEALDPQRVPVRPVPLDAVPTAAVNQVGRVCYRLLMTSGLVLNVLTGEQLTLPAGQTWPQFLEALPDVYVLQHEAMAYKRDNDKVCVRAFAESQVRAADLASSSFA